MIATAQSITTNRCEISARNLLSKRGAARGPLAMANRSLHNGDATGCPVASQATPSGEAPRMNQPLRLAREAGYSFGESPSFVYEIR